MVRVIHFDANYVYTLSFLTGAL